MDALEGVVVGELKDLTQQIVKGKRTKRLRISSPIPFTITNTHVFSYEGVENTIIENNDGDNNNNNMNSSTNLRLSSAASSDDDNSTTTEDEEIARILILLSQGNPIESSMQNDYLDHNYSLPSIKFTSKKYIETSSNGNGKSGMFVYECKTCNRTFPSFQALGGHRASHNKPRNLVNEEIKKRPFSSVFLDDYDYDFDPSPLPVARKNSHSNFTSSISYHSMMNKSVTPPKIHECSYCGAEFTSGQALGGHMRCHRGSNGNNNNNNNNKSKYNYYNNNISNVQPLLGLSSSFSSPLSINQGFVGVKKQKINNDNKDALSLSLSLDLNLPAPPPAENSQKNQQSTEVEFAKEITSPSPKKQNDQQPENNDPTVLLSTTQALVTERKTSNFQQNGAGSQICIQFKYSTHRVIGGGRGIAMAATYFQK